MSDIKSINPQISSNSNAKLMKSLEANRDFIYKMMEFQGKSVSMSEDSDPAIASAKMTELMLQASKVDAAIAEKQNELNEQGSGPFKTHEEAIGKNVDYNSNGRVGTRYENSLSFSYKIDQSRFSPNSTIVSTTLKVVNQNGVLQTTQEGKGVKWGENSFKHTLKPGSDNSDTYKLQVDVVVSDKDGKKTTIRDIADHRGMVEQVKAETGKGKKKLIIKNGDAVEEIDLEQVVGIHKNQEAVDKFKYASMIGHKAIVDNEEIVIAGVDWSDPNEVKFHDLDGKKYNMNDVDGISHISYKSKSKEDNNEEGDDANIVRAADLARPPISGEQRLKLLEQGNAFIGKTAVFAPPPNFNITVAAGEYEVKLDKPSAQYSAVNIGLTGPAIRNVGTDLNGAEDPDAIRAVRDGDKLKIKWPGGMLPGNYNLELTATNLQGRREVIYSSSKRVVGCIVNDTTDELELELDGGAFVPISKVAGVRNA
jgi:hypothetical protein